MKLTECGAQNDQENLAVKIHNPEPEIILFQLSPSAHALLL